MAHEGGKCLYTLLLCNTYVVSFYFLFFVETCFYFPWFSKRSKFHIRLYSDFMSAQHKKFELHRFSLRIDDDEFIWLEHTPPSRCPYSLKANLI